MTPFLLPLFFDDDIYGMYGQLMLCLIACNAPFLDRGSLFTLHRTGRTAWGIAQMIYIVLANIIFMAVMMVTQMIFLFPHLTFSSQWGSVLYTLANLLEIRSKYGGYGSFDAEIILGMSPTAALGMQKRHDISCRFRVKAHIFFDVLLLLYIPDYQTGLR